MLYLKNKDNKNRKRLENIEFKNLSIKFLNSIFSNNPKFASFQQKNNFKIKKQQKFCSKTRLVNRCILTNRSRGVYRKFKVSRILMRKLLLFGALPGYAKSVW